jgi:hypothetical protein
MGSGVGDNHLFFLRTTEWVFLNTVRCDLGKLAGELGRSVVKYAAAPAI